MKFFFRDSSVYVWGSRNISTSRNKRFSHYPPDTKNHNPKKGFRNLDVLNGRNYRGDQNRTIILSTNQNKTLLDTLRIPLNRPMVRVRKVLENIKITTWDPNCRYKNHKILSILNDIISMASSPLTFLTFLNVQKNFIKGWG